MIIEKILKEIKQENEISDSNYMYNGIVVPRTTHILSSMLHEEYLMQWANAIGLYKRKKYTDERDNAAYIGSCAHELIEDYMNSNEYHIDKFDITNQTNYKMVNNAVQSYILWYNTVCKDNIFEVLGMEQTLTCPWFGGTYDMLCRINGKVYLVDFKTSNHISYKYCLQIAAYKYMLNNYYNIEIDGAIILQLDKKVVAFEEYVLDFSNKKHFDFINLCTETYLGLVYSFYNRLRVEVMYKSIF